MKVTVIVPDEYMGDVIGDLNARRGQIQGMEADGRHQRINALFRWPRCSATLPTCVPRPRAVASISWSPTTTRKFPRALPTRSLAVPARRKICRDM